MINHQVLPHRLRHIRSPPSSHEIFYEPTGKEAQPRPIGSVNNMCTYIQVDDSDHYGYTDFSIVTQGKWCWFAGDEHGVTVKKAKYGYECAYRPDANNVAAPEEPSVRQSSERSPIQPLASR